jgi:excinuclease UvrABC ATPase subunit
MEEFGLLKKALTKKILKCDSLTAKYLNGRKNLCSQKKIENINFVEIKGARETTFKI